MNIKNTLTSLQQDCIKWKWVSQEVGDPGMLTLCPLSSGAGQAQGLREGELTDISEESYCDKKHDPEEVTPA